MMIGLSASIKEPSLRVISCRGEVKLGCPLYQKRTLGQRAQCSFTWGSLRRVIARAMVSSPTFIGPCKAASCIL